MESPGSFEKKELVSFWLYVNVLHRYTLQMSDWIQNLFRTLINKCMQPVYCRYQPPVAQENRSSMHPKKPVLLTNRFQPTYMFIPIQTPSRKYSGETFVIMLNIAPCGTSAKEPM